MSFPPPENVFLLSWVGSVLRIDAESGALIHGAPWPVRAVAVDWAVKLRVPGPGITARLASEADPHLVVIPGGAPYQVHIQRHGLYLCASPLDGTATFSRTEAYQWETFRLLREGELAALRHIMGHGWGIAGEATAYRPELLPGMALRIGAYTINLALLLPTLTDDGATLTLPDSAVVLRRGPALAAQGEVRVSRRRSMDQMPRLVADEPAFRANPDSRLALWGAPEYAHLPLAVCRADEDWMLEKWRQPGARRLGRQVNACQMMREHDKYVLLARHREGLIFDEAGASNEIGYVLGVNMSVPESLRREGGHVFIDADTLGAAPHLPGAHAVFYGGNISNYYHWVIDALLPLAIMAPHLPAGTRLLIPGTLQAFRTGPDAGSVVDHMAALREWGFGALPITEMAAPVCHVEEVFWLDHCAIEEMPAQFVQAARAAALARLAAPTAPPHRLYVRRRHGRTLTNARLVEQIMSNNGFIVHDLDGMTPAAQMALFRDAEIVVAAHGAALANLMFCAPGTRVIELSPDCEFRPLFGQISDKCGLTHAVLPCPTNDGGFNGEMTVDSEKLRAMLRLMLMRQ